MAIARYAALKSGSTAIVLGLTAWRSSMWQRRKPVRSRMVWTDVQRSPGFTFRPQMASCIPVRLVLHGCG